MMKLTKTLCSLLLFPVVTVFGAGGGAFTITATLSGLPANSVATIRYKGAGGVQVMDSALITNGHFTLKGSVQDIQQVYIVCKESASARPRYLPLFLEPANITLTGDINAPEEVVISGSPVNKEYSAYTHLFAEQRSHTAPMNKQYNQLNEQFIADKRAGKSEEALQVLKDKMEVLRDSIEPYSQQQREISMNYFRTHPQSYITASQLVYYTSSFSPDTLQAFYNRMGDAMQHTQYGKNLADELARLKAGSPGGIAKDFAVTDITGKHLQLSAYKGKYVLLDFWASWCVPCRRGNPHLRSLYAKYQSKGLEIVGVSDDDSNPAAWKAAVEKDGIGIWKHVLRGLKRTADGGFDKSNDISDGYGIHTLPTKILIDPKGVIIGRYGGGGENDEAMDKKMAEVFGS